MEEKALHILEYDKIISILCGYASSEAGKALCAKITPSTNLKKIREYQKNTTDARKRMRVKGTPLSFRGVKEITDSIKRLKVSATLSAAELMRISSVLTVAQRARDYGMDEEINDSLTEDFSFIEPLTQINREITRCIISEDMIADDASPTLYGIRKKITASADKIHDTMQSHLNSYRDYLTDAVITQRDGRYCLPVKAEYKAKVPGLTHDTSATGMTLFVEPMAIVKLNNEIKELEVEEKKEIEEILHRLSLSLTPHLDDISDDVKILRKLDMVFAKALFAEELDATEPEFSTDRYIELKNARHPLIDKKKCVPITVRLGRDFDLLVVTGPNTGGKTVSLKTVGLLTLMGQAGLHIPADEGSVLGLFESVYADIGDEQSIEQSLSTFSAHMTNIVHIISEADSKSLCLFDELGSGTDPTEGAALAMAVLSFLHRMKTRTMATTHYAEIKVFALKTEGVENACCEFDVASLRPTYRLLIGVPGKSNAFAISRRLGLPDYIIDEAKGFIGEADENFEDVIQKLNDDRRVAEKERLKAEGFRREMEDIRGRIKKKEDKIDESREKIIEDAKAEAAKILKDAKETADETVRNINRLAADADTLKDIETEREKLRAGIKKHDTGTGLKIKGPAKPVSPKKLQVGDTVRVMSLGGTEGTVTSLPDKDGNVSVQMGFMSTKVNVKNLELSKSAESAGKEKSPQASYSGFSPKAMTVSPELNLIGMTTDEAVPALEKYLDDAYLAHLPSARIVHGRGTGALKEAVHSRLKKVKYVKEYRLGVFGEGSDGVTVVTFR
ncbi:MAG: endonuclease MutS2 [Lachnospiraceae bacterium]|nr:endonuclease MutS2 [Lachnospiraceae bacterium]